ncbi:NifU family protein [Kitasatospora acidiphila]|uniref:NifU family protein n=1 Tax=Kitasatospora acidiphila TaxID=2567942 RepID=A0A540WCH5_9ACTN|nr:NifU family protein [Kitasatospora acidiphila]TQF06749.1 NifU family protein [Kitasatospora acidiphila]
MSAPVQSGTDPARTARRIEELLDRLSGDLEASAAGEQLVGALMEFYGAGLARIVELVGAATVSRTLLDDELVAHLLALHDLHPEEPAARIARALAGQPVEVLGFDEGTLRIRASGGGSCGCPSTAAATREAVVAALAGLAPEVTAVELAAEPPALLQIGTRPPGSGS